MNIIDKSIHFKDKFETVDVSPLNKHADCVVVPLHFHILALQPIEDLVAVAVSDIASHDLDQLCHFRLQYLLSRISKLFLGSFRNKPFFD